MAVIGPEKGDDRRSDDSLFDHWHCGSVDDRSDDAARCSGSHQIASTGDHALVLVFGCRMNVR